MEPRRLVVVVVALATLAAGVGFPVAGVAAQETTETADGEEAQMGTQMTAFMQSSAAQANDSVEDGMWQAAFERANESEQARLATQRAQSLGDRIDALQEERERLQALRDNGTISEAEYTARAAELNGRIDALQEAVNGTEQAAEQAGLDVEGLETLKQNASNMTGPEVAGVARGLAGGDRGPPEDAGPLTDAGASTDAGPPTDARPPGDEGTPGPPDPGNGTQAPPGDDPTAAPPGGNDPGGGDGSSGGGDGGEGGNEEGGSGDGDNPGQGNSNPGNGGDNGNVP